MLQAFLAQTAQDYDLPVHIVQQIWEKYEGTGLFYDKLEEYLKSRNLCN